ncbi:MAG: hypothetical protein V1716_01085 [Candidatus Uhrbacteria bacterium]
MAPVTFVKKQDQKEDFEEEFKDIGKRLAYLLAAADLPQDVKESWATLVPEMTLEQIDKLMVVLERYVTSGMSKEFESFKTDLFKIQQKHQEQVNQRQGAALSQLDDLERNLE